MKIAFYPLKGKKPLYTGNSCFARVGVITAVGNISGLLDLVRADPMTEVRSQYRIGKAHGGGGFYIYIYVLRYSDSEIVSAITYRGW